MLFGGTDGAKANTGVQKMQISVVAVDWNRLGLMISSSNSIREEKVLDRTHKAPLENHICFTPSRSLPPDVCNQQNTYLAAFFIRIPIYQVTALV